MANANSITVRVKRYRDRANLVLWYRDPITEKLVTRSAKTSSMSKATKAARDWETELEEGTAVDTKLNWKAFRERYESEYLPKKAKATRLAAATAFNHLERTVNPKRLSSVTSSLISKFGGELRKEGKKDSTIGVHLGHLRVAINWAYRLGLISRKVNFDMPTASKARSRAVTGEEFDRMLSAVPKVRKQDAAKWQRYLRGLWLSGLRLSESLALSWDPDEPFCLDLSGEVPTIGIEGKQKNKQHQKLGITQNFYAFLMDTPEDERHGKVFPSGIGIKQVGRTVSEIGEKAGVVTGRDASTGEPKFASAHDLRRAYGVRWSKVHRPSVLQKMMRHSSIQTTMEFYCEEDQDTVNREVWTGSGNIPGNSEQMDTSPVCKTQQENPAKHGV